ncbi:MAG: DUF3732 domain-containing protein [Saprospiraceae bacterium]|nr:DUF3732 domain-containing protein [Saprospiraceae bacterium]
MKIKNITLYSKAGQQRSITFETDGLNIITGASKRGKSSLIEIIEYCLGASECGVAHGHIRDTVEWYSITVEDGDSELFLARKNPVVGFNSSADCIVLKGHDLEIPTFTNLAKNSNVEGVVALLTEFIGLPPQTTEVPLNQTRSQININFKHTKYLYFQNQDEIANKKFIFHRQGEPFIPQSIKDTLPYFLGAADDHRFSDLEKLRQLKRELKKQLKVVEEAKAIKGKGLTKGHKLLSESIALGMFAGDSFSLTDKELLAELTKILNWKPEPDNFDKDLTNQIAELDKKYSHLIQSKKEVNSKVVELKKYNSAISGYDQAINEQSLRLNTINLFGRLEQLDNGYVQHIKNNLKALDAQLGKSEKTKPRLQGAIFKFEANQSDLAEKIKKVRITLFTLKSKSTEYSKKEKTDIECAKLVGRVSLYLESISWNIDTSESQKRIRELTPLIDELEIKLNPEAMQEKLDAQLNCIGEDLTKWSRELKLEHSEHPIRLDLKKLTVVAETPNGRIPLHQIGSGENWVGYHLVTHLALAKWFINQNRPVANFLFFDQPSQVYFPSDIAIKGQLSEIENDEDREAVKTMFKWISDKVKLELNNKVQVIITDHADIDEPWFQNAVRDNKWRGDYALIPKEWINGST